MLNSGRGEQRFSRSELDISVSMTMGRSPYRSGDIVAGRYEVRTILGSDPLFITHTAIDNVDDLEVLLLVVSPSVISSSVDHQVFVRRAKSAFALNAPGLASVLRIVSDRGSTVVVSDYVRGLPLRKLIERNRRSSEVINRTEAMMILRAIAAALDHASSLCSHGYLIPEHVFLRDEGLNLVATGLISALPSEQTLLELEGAVHVTRYLAPEVLAGTIGAADADLFSLAVIAQDLLGGSPFQKDGSGIFDSLDRLPPLARHFIKQATSEARDDRPRSPSEFVEALAVALEESDSAQDEEDSSELEGPTMVRQSPDLTVKTDAAVLDKVLKELDREEEEVDDDDDEDSYEDEALAQDASFFEETVIDLMVEERAKGTLKEDQYDTDESNLPTAELSDESPDKKLRVETSSALGLDPKLVRAARHLDDKRPFPGEMEQKGPAQHKPVSRYVPPKPALNTSELSPVPDGIENVQTHRNWPIVGMPIVDISSSSPQLTDPLSVEVKMEPPSSSTEIALANDDSSKVDASEWPRETMRYGIVADDPSEEEEEEEEYEYEDEEEDFDDLEPPTVEMEGLPFDSQEWTKDTDKIAAIPNPQSAPFQHGDVTGGGVTTAPVESRQMVEPVVAQIATQEPLPLANPVVQLPPETPNTPESQEFPASSEVPGNPPPVQEQRTLQEVPPEPVEEPVSAREASALVVDVSRQEALSSQVLDSHTPGENPLAGLQSAKRARRNSVPMIPTGSEKWSWALIGAILGSIMLVMYIVTFVLVWVMD